MVDTFSYGSTYLSITPIDGSDMDFKAIIETVDLGGGAKEMESIPTIADGRLVKFNAQEDFEITLEGYAVECASSSTTGNGFYDLMYSSNTDSTQPLSVSVDNDRTKHRLVILATDNNSQTNATSATSSGDRAMKWTFKNGYFTNVAASFTDGVWKFTVTFKCPPKDKSGASNLTIESSDGTAVIPASDSYTS